MDNNDYRSLGYRDTVNEHRDDIHCTCTECMQQQHELRLMQMEEDIKSIRPVSTIPVVIASLDMDDNPGVILDEDGNELSEADFWDGTGEPYWLAD